MPGNRGITLLEILVSVSILAVVMGIIYGSYTSNVDAIQTARGSGMAYQTARIILDRMGRDLESAFIPKGPLQGPLRMGFLCVDKEMEGRPADQLDFTALTYFSLNPTGPITDLCEIGYYLKENEVGDGLILQRRCQMGPDEDPVSGGEERKFSEMVVGLDFTFHDAEGNIHESWNSLEGEQQERLPSLVVIRLTITDPQGQEVIFKTSVHPETAEPEK